MCIREVIEPCKNFLGLNHAFHQQKISFPNKNNKETRHLNRIPEFHLMFLSQLKQYQELTFRYAYKNK